MNLKHITIAALVFGVLTFTAARLWALPQPQERIVQRNSSSLPTDGSSVNPASTSSPPSQTPTVGTAVVSPSIISVNATTTVTITVPISPHPSHARLFIQEGKRWYFSGHLYLSTTTPGTYTTSIQYITNSYIFTDTYKVVADFAHWPASVSSNTFTVSVWNAFADPFYHLTMLYPPGWHVTNISDPAGGGTTRFSNTSTPGKDIQRDLLTESFFEINTLVNYNPSALPIDQWFNRFFSGGIDNPPVNVSLTTLTGLPAIMSQTGDVGTLQNYFIVSPLNSTDVIAVSYRLDAAQFLPKYDLMLSTLTF